MKPILFRCSLLAWAAWLALVGTGCEKPLASESEMAAKLPARSDPSAKQAAVAPVGESSEALPELAEPDDKHPVSVAAFLQPARVRAGRSRNWWCSSRPHRAGTFMQPTPFWARPCQRPEAAYRERVIKGLARKAAELGYRLEAVSPAGT
jgi:hypothetical protein